MVACSSCHHRCLQADGSAWVPISLRPWQQRPPTRSGGPSLWGIFSLAPLHTSPDPHKSGWMGLTCSLLSLHFLLEVPNPDILHSEVQGVSTCTTALGRTRSSPKPHGAAECWEQCVVQGPPPAAPSERAARDARRAGDPQRGLGKPAQSATPDRNTKPRAPGHVRAGDRQARPAAAWVFWGSLGSAPGRTLPPLAVTRFSQQQGRPERGRQECLGAGCGWTVCPGPAATTTTVQPPVALKKSPSRGSHPSPVSCFCPCS